MPSIPRPIKILLIDDDKILVREIEARLATAGFFVTTASDGTAGLALFEANPYDLVLTDLVMPGMTGFEVIKRMRDRNPAVPIAALSLLGQEEDVKHAMESGANKYFAKKNASFFDDVVAYAETVSTM